MTTAQICIMATIICYLCFVIVTGIMIGRRSKKSAEGFYLGGRGMGPLVTAMSAEASDMSGWLLMGFPGSILAFGMGNAGYLYQSLGQVKHGLRREFQHGAPHKKTGPRLPRA